MAKHINQYITLGNLLKKLEIKKRLNGTSLKQQLLRNYLLKNECYECQLKPFWNNKELSLHLDHIDGDGTNNQLNNLRLLCPNCHSQTDTYCGKSLKGKYAPKTCPICKKKLASWSNKCKACEKAEMVQEGLKYLSFLKETIFVSDVAKQFNVSNKLVQRRIAQATGKTVVDWRKEWKISGCITKKAFDKSNKKS